MIVLFILAGTTIFYYPFVLISGTYFSYLIPIILTSCYLYIPSYYSIKTKALNEEHIKKLVFVNNKILKYFIIIFSFKINENGHLNIFVN